MPHWKLTHVIIEKLTMSKQMEEEIKRWLTKRKSMLTQDITSSKTTVAGSQLGMENTLRSTCGRQGAVKAPAQDTCGCLGQSGAETACQKSLQVLLTTDEEVIKTIHQAL